MQHKLYAVRSQDGKFFRSKGYGGGGASWVDGLDKAKIYGSIGPARSRVTFWATNYPKFGTPEIVEITVTDSNIRAFVEEDRVKKVKDRKEREKIRREKQKEERIALSWWNKKSTREKKMLIRGYVENVKPKSDGPFNKDNITVTGIINLYNHY